MIEKLNDDVVTGRRRSVEVACVLGITTTVGYGTLYYAFGVVSRTMAIDTGLSLTSVYGLFSLGLVFSGMLATRAGSLFDRFDPATIMAAGSGLSTIFLCAFALLPGKWFYAVNLIMLQAVSTLVLYEAAFVAAAKYVPYAPRRTITGITLIAGFASTIFWPATDMLLETYSWRQIYLLFAALHLIFGLVPHLWLARRLRPGKNLAPQQLASEISPILKDKRHRKIAYFLLIVGFTGHTFVISSIHLHLIGFLDAIGLAASAALIGAIIGPAQVAGRLIEFVLADRLSMFAVTLFSAFALPSALLLLLWTAPWAAAAVIFAVMFGLGQGLSYIARGVFPLELFGSSGFGSLMGRMNSVRLYVSAGAPFVAAAIAERAGVTSAIYVIGLAGALALAAFAAIAPLMKRR